MGLNFGAIAQGISNVLEEDKKLKAAEKRLERQFENDVKKISMRTALDRETEALRKRREKREKEKNLALIYKPDLAAFLIKNDMVDSALSFADNAQKARVDPNDYIETVTETSGGWEEKDFAAAERAIRNYDDVDTPESKMYAGFDDLNQTQKKSLEEDVTTITSARLKPLPADVKTNSTTAYVNSLLEEQAKYKPGSAMYKEIQGKITRALNVAQDIAVKTDTTAPKSLTTKLNVESATKNMILGNPLLSKNIEPGMEDSFKFAKEGNLLQYTIGMFEVGVSFYNNYGKNSAYKDDPAVKAKLGSLQSTVSDSLSRLFNKNIMEQKQKPNEPLNILKRFNKQYNSREEIINAAKTGQFDAIDKPIFLKLKSGDSFKPVLYVPSNIKNKPGTVIGG